MIDMAIQTDPIPTPTVYSTSTPTKCAQLKPVTDISPIKECPSPEPPAVNDPDYHPSDLSMEEAHQEAIEEAKEFESEQELV